MTNEIQGFSRLKAPYGPCVYLVLVCVCVRVCVRTCVCVSSFELTIIIITENK